MNVMYRCAGILLAVFVLVACSGNGSEEGPDTSRQDVKPVQKVTLGDFDRIHSVGPLYIASQPSVSDLETMKEKGVVSVINLRPADETPDRDEQKQVEERGMKYIHIPLSSPDQADAAFFTEVRKQLRTVESPALLHCSSANRAGSAWLAYRVLDEGVSLDKALEEARQVGMRSDKLEERARQYIEENQ